MDTTHLDSFVAVAQYGSVAEAARRTGLTATAVAQRVRVLEQQFGVRLVVRAGRTVRLTEAGERLLRQTRPFQTAIKALQQAVASDGLIGPVRLGSISSALTGLVPGMLRVCDARHPEVGIHIELGTSHELYQRLLDDQLDAAVVVRPPFQLPKAIHWALLRAEPLELLVPAELAARCPFELLRDEPFIRYHQSSWGGAFIDDFLRRHDLLPHERFQLDSMDGIAHLVAIGLGVSLVPSTGPSALLPAGVRSIAVDSAGCERPVGLAYRHGEALGPLLMSYAAAARSSLGEGGARVSP